MRLADPFAGLNAQRRPPNYYEPPIGEYAAENRKRRGPQFERMAALQLP